MSRLKSRLGRRGKDKTEEVPETTAAPEVDQSKSSLISQLQKRMDKVSARHATKKESCPDFEQDRPKNKKINIPQSERIDLPGDVIETSAGTVLCIKKIYPPSYRHGRYYSANFLTAGTALQALALDERLKGFTSKGAIFLDTETTGLSGGTGTIPFLIGIGWLEKDGSFVVEQFFCREPGEEPAQLELLAKRLCNASSLVTFNGRSFDIPLVNTRFILNRIKNPGYALPHLDLLHVARRVFKRRLKRCNLQNLEAAVLGFERTGDIPGHAIPAAYAEYVKGGPSDAMEAVLEHNALDLVGLASLGARLEEMYNNPEEVEHAADHLGLAKAAFAAGNKDAADQHLTRAGDAAEGADSIAALMMAYKAAIKRKQLDEAKALLYKALECKGDDLSEAVVHLALSKHLEHKDKDFEKALEHAGNTVELEGDEGTEHRMARLKKKLEKVKNEK